MRSLQSQLLSLPSRRPQLHRQQENSEIQLILQEPADIALSGWCHISQTAPMAVEISFAVAYFAPIKECFENADQLLNLSDIYNIVVNYFSLKQILSYQNFMIIIPYLLQIFEFFYIPVPEFIRLTSSQFRYCQWLVHKGYFLFIFISELDYSKSLQ